MLRYLLTAVAVAAIASPAYAQTSGPYIGIEGGLLFPRDTSVDVEGFDTDADLDLDLDYKRGRDLDAIAGYDLGTFRLEAELGFKRAKIKAIEVNGEDFDEDDLDENGLGRARVRSIMGNALADFGTGGARFYGGGGFGRARVKFSGDGESDTDSAWAWQLIAGVGVPVAPNVELGAKYRFFRTRKLDYDFNDADVGDDGVSLGGRFSSHSLLASLIFGFGVPVAAPYAAPVESAPPPPPPPPAPATQTCPDGSVVMANDFCPTPPPPPPPPYPRPERG
jgi:opacity protein-like surface antigen